MSKSEWEIRGDAQYTQFLYMCIDTKIGRVEEYWFRPDHLDSARDRILIY